MSNDDERIARLTDLARRVWPDEDAQIVSGFRCAGVYGRPGEQMLAMVLAHPRALDALEAALMVLSGETPLVAAGQDAMCKLIERSSLGEAVARMKADPEAELERIDAELTDEVMDQVRAATGEPPGWVEQLAIEWEEDAGGLRAFSLDPAQADNGPFARGAAAARIRCADELRKRATKEGR